MDLIYKLFGVWIMYCIKENLDIWNKFGGPKISNKTLTKKLEQKK